MIRGRRNLLAGGAGLLAAAGAVGAWRFWPEQGLWNPCRGGLPAALAEHPLVKSAWQGISPDQVWDSHAHLLGLGDAGSGIEIHPSMRSLLHPVEFGRREFFMNAACAEPHRDAPTVDEAYVERLRRIAGELPAGMKLLLFAFDRAHAEDGSAAPGRTSFHVPDAYAKAVAARDPGRFEWVASVHPYRQDALEALRSAIAGGARAVKWLPSAMNIDPASPRCDHFYAALAAGGLPLVSHAGDERAVPGANQQEFGNPLRLRRALDAGVRVVVAHCASMGRDRDIDRGEGGPSASSFELFSRLMDEPRARGLLHADIAAVTQSLRAETALRKILEREDWHGRLLNGSDYPLPGLMPIFSLQTLVDLAVLDADAVPVLTDIRRHNVLVFDFVLKRALRFGTHRLPASVFQTRRFFEAARAG